MSGKLFIVPTPVGNMADMTPRAVEVLESVDAIYAEDTRTSGKLMKHFGVTTRLIPFHKFNEHASVEKVVERLKSGDNLALISDAGTPGISDPGFLLSRACRDNGLDIETLPGATAFVPALVNSGLPCDKFFFEGFLPVKKGRTTRMQWLAALPCSFIVYESPVRLTRTLADFIEVAGAERNASVSREISKLHNSTVNGTLQEILEHFTANPPKGEIVIIIEGCAQNEGLPKVHVNKYKDRTN